VIVDPGAARHRVVVIGDMMDVKGAPGMAQGAIQGRGSRAPKKRLAERAKIDRS
jgi:hypothetical protein